MVPFALYTLRASYGGWVYTTVGVCTLWWVGVRYSDIQSKTAEWDSQDFNLNAVHSTSMWGIRDARAKNKYIQISKGNFSPEFVPRVE